MTEEREAAANAYVSGNAALVSGLSVKTGPATFFGPGGGLIVGAEKIITTNERGAKSFEPGSKSKFKVAQQAAGERSGVLVGDAKCAGKVQGKPGKVTMNLRVTEVFRREKGGWKLIHRHADMLTKPAKPKK